MSDDITVSGPHDVGSPSKIDRLLTFDEIEEVCAFLRQRIDDYFLRLQTGLTQAQVDALPVVWCLRCNRLASSCPDGMLHWHQWETRPRDSTGT